MSRAGASLLLAAALVLGLGACEREPPPIAAADYAALDDAPRCAAGSRAGAAGATDGVEAAGIECDVRTPANYDPTVAHPLLVVLPAAGMSGRATERFTGLTGPATAAGMIVAYPDAERLSLAVIRRYAQIPKAIAGRWCVDERRVFFTGHSDGGTASSAIAFLEQTRGTAAAIAPSAAGIAGPDLEDTACPPPLPVFVQHNAGDRLFPGYGAEAAAWWARCNGCSDAALPAEAGCHDYQGCAAATRYCTGPGGHTDWPGRNAEIIDFFLAAARANGPTGAAPGSD